MAVLEDVALAAQPDFLGGEVTGLRIVPSWAGVDNPLYLIKADDMILLESSTFNSKYEEVLGPSSIRIGVWGYAAPVLTRYAASTVRINAVRRSRHPSRLTRNRPRSAPAAVRGRAQRERPRGSPSRVCGAYTRHTLRASVSVGVNSTPTHSRSSVWSAQNRFQSTMARGRRATCLMCPGGHFANVPRKTERV